MAPASAMPTRCFGPSHPPWPLPPLPRPSPVVLARPAAFFRPRPGRSLASESHIGLREAMHRMGGKGHRGRKSAAAGPVRRGASTPSTRTRVTPGHALGTGI